MSCLTALTIAMPKTRLCQRCPVFGSFAEMPPSQLPTHFDVMRSFLLMRHNMKPTEACKEPSVSAISEVLTCKIEKLWQKSSIPIISHKRICDKIRLYHREVLRFAEAIQGLPSLEWEGSPTSNSRRKFLHLLLRRDLCFLTSVSANVQIILCVNVQRTKEFCLLKETFWLTSDSQDRWWSVGLISQ